jgi:large subunit ribosomal protein L1
LMPNPKLGTVTNDVVNAIENAKGGEVQFRVEKQGIVHAGIGKASFSEEQLGQNVSAFLDAILRAKPSGIKGTYLKRLAISSTMGPGVRVDVSSLPSSPLSAD